MLKGWTIAGIALLISWGSVMCAENMVRPAAQAGRFYESDPAKLRQTVRGMLEQHRNDAMPDSVVALIVPHAGHRYSGPTAAAAYMSLHPEHRYKRIFLLGPSHHVALEGASVAAGYTAYAGPWGEVPVDTAVCHQLIAADPVFSFRPEAHAEEHALEVQLPFLVERLDVMPAIVPVLIHTYDKSHIRRIADALRPYFNGENLFVISSDFSHYPSYADARRIDGMTAEAVRSGNLDQFYTVLESNRLLGIHNLRTSACGEASIAVLLTLLDRGCEIHHLLYANSGDVVPSQRDQVVGYHAFCVTRHQGFWLKDSDKAALRNMANESIRRFFRQEIYLPEPADVNATLRVPCGAFVTLRRNGELRGCIGHIGDDVPLYEVVCRMARAAAFQDYRFSPLRKSEWKRVTLEISVLTPPKRIDNVEEIELGRHGILIRKEGRRGTFLPQVADEMHWTLDEFLGHCARDKAGLTWDGWKDAELYTYESIIF